MDELLAWLREAPERRAHIMSIAGGLWLVELSTPMKPYCPGRCADFAEAVELAIASEKSRG
jgi:hypothetical protein